MIDFNFRPNSVFRTFSCPRVHQLHGNIFSLVRGKVNILFQPSGFSRVICYPGLINDEFSLQSRGDIGLDGLLPLATPLAARSFSITIDAEIEEREYRREAVIQMTGDDARPYFVLRWR